MFSIKLIESGLEDLNRITRADFYLCDENGEVLVNTFSKMEIDKEVIESFFESSAESQNMKGYYFQKLTIEDNERLVLIVYAGGNDGYTLSRIASSEIIHLIGAKTGSKDKIEFFKDILLDNILPVDIEKRAKISKVRENLTRIIYNVQVDEELTDSAYELLNNIFSDNRDDIVIIINEGRIIIVKSISINDYEDNLDDYIYENANLIVSMINTELMIKAKVTFGRATNDLKKLSEIYKEAVMALEVMNIFYEEKNIASYTSLGIGRLIHQLPEGLCNLFLNEVLGEKADKISKDEIEIIDSFFENDLNVAETAREMSMNRTTLIYKIDKLKKKTGLDIRKFEDALTLKIAMMVDKYLKYKSSEYRN